MANNSNVSQWSLETGYKSESIGNEYPLRMIESGRNAALELSLMIYERDFEYLCRGFDQGFKIILSTPGDSMKMLKTTLRVPVLEDSLIAIKPKVTRTSHGLRSYKPNAFSVSNVNCVSLKFTHKTIAKQNIWPISQKTNADV